MWSGLKGIYMYCITIIININVDVKMWKSWQTFFCDKFIILTLIKTWSKTTLFYAKLVTSVLNICFTWWFTRKIIRLFGLCWWSHFSVWKIQYFGNGLYFHSGGDIWWNYYSLWQSYSCTMDINLVWKQRFSRGLENKLLVSEKVECFLTHLKHVIFKRLYNTVVENCNIKSINCIFKEKHEVVISNADTNILTYNKNQDQELILYLVL